jgi:hypothetical protein
MLLRMKNVSDKSCRENQNTYYVQWLFLFSKNRVVYKITSKNMMEPKEATNDSTAHARCMLDK